MAIKRQKKEEEEEKKKEFLFQNIRRTRKFSINMKDY